MVRFEPGLELGDSAMWRIANGAVLNRFDGLDILLLPKSLDSLCKIGKG